MKQFILMIWMKVKKKYRNKKLIKQFQNRD